MQAIVEDVHTPFVAGYIPRDAAAHLDARVVLQVAAVAVGAEVLARPQERRGEREGKQKQREKKVHCLSRLLASRI